MLPYWLLFLAFATGAIAFSLSAPRMGLTSEARESAHGTGRSPLTGDRQWLLSLAALLTAMMIGLRYRVGTDWGAYVDIFNEIAISDFWTALNRIDPGYAALNWLVGAIGGDFWLVNLVCGLLFMFGLVRFAKAQPNPWLAFAVAVPYFIIGVGMGYSRQAVAIAFAMSGLAAISRSSFARFVLWVLAGALFHRTVVILIPIVGLAYTRNRLQGVLVGIVGCLAGYYLLTSGQGLEHFQRAYVSRVYESQGAGIRLAMNVPAALIFLGFAGRFTADRTERLVWRNFAIVAISSLAAWLFVQSTAPLDRMALYIIPLQVYVFSRLPTVFAPHGSSRMLVIAVVAYSALVEFVWLNFANNARYWVPYELYDFI